LLPTKFHFMADQLILIIFFSFIFQVAIAQREIIGFTGKEAGGVFFAESGFYQHDWICVAWENLRICHRYYNQ